MELYKFSKNIIRDQLDGEYKIMLEDFSSIKENPYLQRINIILKFKLFKYGIIRNIGLLLKIWILKLLSQY